MIEPNANKQRQEKPKLANANFSLAHLQEEMNTLFERFYTSAHGYIEDWSAAHIPLVNVIDGGGVFYVEAAMPGVSPERMTVEIEGDRLTISGTSRAAREEREYNFLRREMHAANFRRMISLPSLVDGEMASAILAEGLLTVTLPKKDGQASKPRTIDVKKAG